MISTTATGDDTSLPPPEVKPATETADELTPEELKRVRFSVGHLTTEYYPYQPSEEDGPASDDADIPSDESASLTAQSDEQPASDARKTTPRELYTFYENACRNKEEPMLDVFVSTVIVCDNFAVETTVVWPINW